jgi:hypothetical protein
MAERPDRSPVRIANCPEVGQFVRNDRTAAFKAGGRCTGMTAGISGTRT